MSITIGSNISSLTAQRNLGKSTKSLTSVYQKLSSGSRINKACDDAAGLAIADTLKANQKIAGVAIRNANDGISSIAIADGAMNEISNVLSRLAELAEQSANGTYSNDQRSALNGEFSQLTAEITRIVETTQFNGVDLIKGNSAITLQVGLDNSDNSKIQLVGANISLSALQLDSKKVDTASDALAALAGANSAIAILAQRRGTYGAVESRLNTAVANLETSKENFANAESQIRDTDVAAEAAELTRLNILQQAGTAVLAQANQQPQLALSLLG